jgi:arylsulfatase A-like enzyme
MSEEDFAILRGLYDGEVSYMDFRIGQLYTLLREAGVLRNTLLIITSDHGENLGDHHLMDHAYCLYDTLLGVPLIVCGLADFAPGQRITHQVQTLDLFPTILELAGIQDEGVWRQVQGQALFPADLPKHAERPAIAEYLEPQPSLPALRKRFPEFAGTQYDRTLRTLRTRDAKYIWASDGRDEFYDLRRDPHEEHNVIATEAGRAGELRTALAEWVKAVEPAAVAHEQAELDALTLKRLEELGYIQ